MTQAKEALSSGHFSHLGNLKSARRNRTGAQQQAPIINAQSLNKSRPASCHLHHVNLS
jgi:hypothetical protein